MHTTTLGMQLCTSNCVGAALPHQCLAWCDILLAAFFHPSPEAAGHPRLIRRQNATAGIASASNLQVAPSTRLYAAHSLAGAACGHGHDIPCARRCTVSPSQKIPAEPLIPGNPHGHKHSRETAHTGATWIWTSKTPRLAGKLYVATWSSGCLNYSLSVLHMGRHLRFSPTALELAALTTALSVHGSVVSILPCLSFKQVGTTTCVDRAVMFRNTRAEQGPECRGGQGTAQTPDAQSSPKAVQTWHFQHS